MDTRGTSDGRGFTLPEILATVSIIALLALALGVFVPNLIGWARETRDKQTLAVLNDALNRYKTQGGGVAGLTAGAPIRNVLSRLQTPVNWAGLSHQFLRGGATYAGRSISAAGNGTDYRFTRYDTYRGETPAAGVPTDTYPYGLGVGYMSNGGHAGGYSVQGTSSSGWVAWKSNAGSITYTASGAITTLPIADSYTVWSCAGNGNNTPSGTLTRLDCTYSQLNSTYVSGLTGLQSLYINDNQLTSLHLSGLPSLSILYCQSNQIPTLDLSGMGLLMILNCHYNQIARLDLRNLPALEQVVCDHNQMTEMFVSGCTSLWKLHTQYNDLATIDVSGLSNLNSFRCNHNELGPINTTGCTSLPAPSTNSSTNFKIEGNPSVTVTGQWTYP